MITEGHLNETHYFHSFSHHFLTTHFRHSHTSEGSTGISALEQQAQFTYNFNEQELALIRNAAELYLSTETRTEYRVATEALRAAYNKLPCVLPSTGCIMAHKGLDLAWQRYCAYSSCHCIECVFRAYGEAVFQEIARQVKNL